MLTEEERLTLARLAARRKTTQALATRARIVLACARPEATNRGMAGEVGVSEAMAGKSGRRFVERRSDALFDESRTGHPRTISDVQVEAATVKALEQKPIYSAHWSTRSMAEDLGMSQMSISLIWLAFGLAPHQAESFKLPTGPLVCGHGARRLRAAPGPPGAGCGYVGAREIPGPGPRPVPSDPADDARDAGAAQTIARYCMRISAVAASRNRTSY